MHYCIYLRKSRTDIDAELRGEGETLARHERTLIELARLKKINITEIYKEVVSGETIAARPVMQKLLSEVEQGVWKGVLVMEIERLARGDTIDQGIMAQTFKYSNTKIITPLKTYDPNNEFDEEYFEFGLFMSRREYKTTNRRLQRGRLASAKEGKYVGNKAPYGYARKKIERDKGFTLEPNPEESEIVKLIFDLYTRGEEQADGAFKRLGVSLICHKLNSMKITPRKADAWVPGSIRDILINPVYAGKIRWNWRPAIKKMDEGEVVVKRPRSDLENCILTEGLHEAIIDNDTWTLAQVFMKKNPPHPAPSKYHVKNPLSGLVRCGNCGRRMTRRPYSKNEPDTLMCPVAHCNNISSHLYLVEEHVLQALQKWLDEYKVTYVINNKKSTSSIQIDIKKKTLKKLDEDIKNIETQISNLHDLLEQGIYSTETFLARSKILSDKIKQSQQNRADIAVALDLDIAREKTRESILPKVERVLAIYSSTESPKDKNDLLKEVLDHVVYTKTVNTRWHGDPNDFDVELFPKMPQC